MPAPAAACATSPPDLPIRTRDPHQPIDDLPHLAD